MFKRGAPLHGHAALSPVQEAAANSSWDGSRISPTRKVDVKIPGSGRASDVNFGVEVHEKHRFLIDLVPHLLRCKEVSCPKVGALTAHGKRARCLRRPLTCRYFRNAVGENQTEQAKPIAKQTSQRQLCHRTTLIHWFPQHRTANSCTFDERAKILRTIQE